MFQRLTLIGNLGNDPEVRYSQSGEAITNISVATSEKWKDKNGEAQERTEWHRVTFFGRLAEIAGEYLTKGSKVYIEGRIRTEKYTDKEGVERYATKVMGDLLKMLSSKQDGEQGQSRGGDRGGQQRGGGQANRGGEKYGGREAPQRGGGYSNDNDPFPDDSIPFD